MDDERRIALKRNRIKTALMLAGLMMSCVGAVLVVAGIIHMLRSFGGGGREPFYRFWYAYLGLAMSYLGGAILRIAYKH